MPTNPKFSIIIPVYNAEAYLRECLDSVWAQTIGDWEAICVDDGSTDGSNGILREYAARDSRIRVLTQPNAGPSVARNAGIDAATGEWVVFLDSDDTYDSDYLESFDCGIKRVDGNVDFLCIGVRRNDKPLFQYTDTGALDLTTGAMIEKYDLCYWCFSVSRCVRRALLNRHNIRLNPNLRYSEDVAFLWQVMLRSRACVLCAGAPYYYRPVMTSLSAKWPARDVLETGRDYFAAACREMSERYAFSEAYSRRIRVITYYVFLRQLVIKAFHEEGYTQASAELLEELFRDRKTMRWYVHDQGSPLRRLTRLVLSVLPLPAIKWYYRHIPDRFLFR